MSAMVRELLKVEPEWTSRLSSTLEEMAGIREFQFLQVRINSPWGGISNSKTSEVNCVLHGLEPVAACMELQPIQSVALRQMPIGCGIIILASPKMAQVSLEQIEKVALLVNNMLTKVDILPIGEMVL